MVGPHEFNRNWRGNPSLLIRFAQESNEPQLPLQQPAMNDEEDENQMQRSDHGHVPSVIHIQIDLCKTFRESMLRFYPRHGVSSLDAVWVTHEHADAIFGVDDVRGIQRYVEDPHQPITNELAELLPPNPPDNDREPPSSPSHCQPGSHSSTTAPPHPHSVSAQPLPVYVSTPTFHSVKNRFGYLVKDQGVTRNNNTATTEENNSDGPTTKGGGSSHAASSGNGNTISTTNDPSDATILNASSSPPTVVVERRVSQLSWRRFYPFVACNIYGLHVRSLPVLHGEDYVCMAFLFGTGLGLQAGKDCVLYMSDVSRIPEATWTYLTSGVLPMPPNYDGDQDGSTLRMDEQTLKFYDTFNYPNTHPLPQSQRQKWKHMPDLPMYPTRTRRSEQSAMDGQTSSSLPSSSTSSSSSPIPSSSPFSCRAPHISLLILDTLFPSMRHNTHFNLSEALNFIERLQPDRALITGMSDLFEYERDNGELIKRRQDGRLTVDVQLAYDGLTMPLNL